MTSRSEIEKTVRSLYDARVRGDLEAVMRGVHDDAAFELNGRGTGVPSLVKAQGKDAIKSAVKELIEVWRFEDFKEISCLVDGDKAAVHWKGCVTFLPTGKSETFDFFDAYRFRDGTIVNLRQNTDTSLAMSLTAAQVGCGSCREVEMTSRAEIEKVVRSLYDARVRGDLEGVLRDVADDATFELNGRGTGVPSLAKAAKGKAAITSVVKELIEAWRFEDFREISFLVDGDRAVVHWKCRATFHPTGKSETFDIVDAYTFRDGKITNVRQNTDTSLVMSLTAA